MMRKFIIGGLVGAALMFGIQAGAASLIGSKVAGTKDVTLNGTTVGQAVIINNSSYLPVRAISNALDLGIDLSGGKINLNEQEQSTPTSTSSRSLNEIQIDIDKWALQKRLLEGQVSQYQKKIDNGEDTEYNRKQLEQMKSTLDMVNQKLEALEKEKAAIAGTQSYDVPVSDVIFSAPDVVLSGE